MFFRASKIFYGQVHFGFLLVPGQVEIFTISTTLTLMFKFCNHHDEEERAD